MCNCVQDDQSERLGVNRQEVQVPQVALPGGALILIILRANAYSNPIIPKRLSIEHSKSYRLMYN